jgi:membrane-associated phospholipid phosphatase
MAGVPQPALGQTVSPAVQDKPAIEAATSETPIPGLGAVFQDTIRGFRRLPSEDSTKWLMFGAAVAALGHQADRPTSRMLSGVSGLDGVFDSGEAIGGARTQLAGALATYAVGRVTRSSKIASVGASLVEAQIMTQALTAAIKMTARRTRPDGTLYSFPSGHSSVTFASATVLQRELGWKAGIPAYGVATYVAASRIQEKRHFLSDVAFGAAIGIMTGRTVTVGRGSGRFALGPVAAPGGAGISFAWVGRH